ncbi:MAG: flagellar biosynthetic protein FliO [Planctomycetaceae bacterium]|jgi:flagellar biogenesis protein FliO|nr:flagellar biosynthetic protein FliO [Planctomycetaceae bacterium]
MSPFSHFFRFSFFGGVVFGSIILSGSPVCAQSRLSAPYSAPPSAASPADKEPLIARQLEGISAGFSRKIPKEPERLPPPPKSVQNPSSPVISESPVLRSAAKLPLPQKPVVQASFGDRPARPVEGYAEQPEEPSDPLRNEQNAADSVAGNPEYVAGQAPAKESVLDKPLTSKKKPAEGSASEKSGSQAAQWKDKLIKPGFSSAVTPILSVAGSLLIVTASFFLVASFLRKVSPKGSRPLPKEAFENLGRIYLSQKHHLHLLRLGNRVILVSAMPDCVKTISEITDPDEVLALLGMCRRNDVNSATMLFQKAVADMSAEEISRPPAVTRRHNTQRTGTVDLCSDPDDVPLADILAGGGRSRRY